jgi:hypothetical protein
MNVVLKSGVMNGGAISCESSKRLWVKYVGLGL